MREAAKDLFADRGYESTSTAAICRLAGTSQSQLIKHFTNKQGLFEAIFEYAWEQINPAVRLATENIASTREKLTVLIDMVLGFLEKDRAIRTLFLLEGRRMRGDGHMIGLVPGFREFIKMLDGILKELAAQGELAPNIHPQAFRSALMGAIEAMPRDRHAGPYVALSCILRGVGHARHDLQFALAMHDQVISCSLSLAARPTRRLCVGPFDFVFLSFAASPLEPIPYLLG